jgi:hypothetical protein
LKKIGRTLKNFGSNRSLHGDSKSDVNDLILEFEHAVADTRKKNKDFSRRMEDERQNGYQYDIRNVVNSVDIDYNDKQRVSTWGAPNATLRQHHGKVMIPCNLIQISIRMVLDKPLLDTRELKSNLLLVKSNDQLSMWHQTEPDC